MIVLVSQSRDLVIETSCVERNGRDIACHTPGKPLFMGRYATTERAQEVMDKIIDAMCKKKIVQHMYDYDRQYGSTTTPTVVKLPKE